MRYYLLLIATTLSISACQTTPVVQGPFTKEQVKPMLDAAISEFGPDLMKVALPKDYAEFCPNFPNLSHAERRQFYTELGYWMIRYESNFKPETKYTESFDDAQGKPVISRGLFQISIESANGYGCGFKNPEDLHDPQANINCGVRILNRWVGRDGYIGKTVGKSNLGGARYWSVLRAHSGSRPKIVSAVKAISICKGE